MMVDTSWLAERCAARGTAAAFIHDGRTYDYRWIAEAVGRWGTLLDRRGIPAGATVALCGDFSPEVAALLLALIGHKAIIVPVSTAATGAGQRTKMLEIAEVEWVADALRDPVELQALGPRGAHPLFAELRRRGSAGLVLFSSGSTGEIKGAVHDFALLLEKFKVPRPALRTLAFLLFDHIGGLNTLFHVLSNGGTVVTPSGRAPTAVALDIERHRVELLPTSPTFLNLLLVSEEHRRRDLSSLSLVTYGTEAMPERLLRRLHEDLPHVRLQQTYGLSELGILRTQSRANDSLWMRIGGEGFETQVRDGVLWIRARSAMLGYLNAPAPFDADGWFNTGDRVEVDGEYIRVLGRDSELINVGGEKVYPAEVESTLLEIDGVLDATVRGEANPLLGQIVTARVRLREPEPVPAFMRRMRAHCDSRLARFKIPLKVELVTEEVISPRFKKSRRG